MPVTAPTFAYNHPDYTLECEVALDVHVQEIIDDAAQAGWDTRTVIRALEEVAKAKAIAYGEDPDPEDDASETDATTPEFSAFPVD
jgi:hypothetical protein